MGWAMPRNRPGAELVVRQINCWLDMIHVLLPPGYSASKLVCADKPQHPPTSTTPTHPQPQIHPPPYTRGRTLAVLSGHGGRRRSRASAFQLAVDALINPPGQEVDKNTLQDIRTNGFVTDTGPLQVGFVTDPRKES